MSVSASLAFWHMAVAHRRQQNNEALATTALISLGAPALIGLDGGENFTK